MELNKRKLNDIEYLETNAEGDKPIAVLFHGYGADFSDLAPLTSYLDPDKKFHWLFPNGILEIPIAPMMSGRAWFPIDYRNLEKAYNAQGTLDLRGIRPDGFDRALASVKEFLGSFRKVQFVGGFSQGAMISLEACMGLKEKPKGLALLSTTYVDQKTLVTNFESLKGVKIFQSHGTQDPLLSFDRAKELHFEMKAANLNCEFFEFGGQHEIPMEIIQRLKFFLSQF